jgi:hypothetical protein
VASGARKSVQTAWRSKPGIAGIGNGGCDASSQWGALGHCDKQSGIVSKGTPDLSGRAFNHADLLPHKCGVPSQRPGAAQRNFSSRRDSLRRVV